MSVFLSRNHLSGFFLCFHLSLGEDNTCRKESGDLVLNGASLEIEGGTSNPSESATLGCAVVDSAMLFASETAQAESHEN